MIPELYDAHLHLELLPIDPRMDLQIDGTWKACHISPESCPFAIHLTIETYDAGLQLKLIRLVNIFHRQSWATDTRSTRVLTMSGRTIHQPLANHQLFNLLSRGVLLRNCHSSLAITHFSNNVLSLSSTFPNSSHGAYRRYALGLFSRTTYGVSELYERIYSPFPIPFIRNSYCPPTILFL